MFRPQDAIAHNQRLQRHRRHAQVLQEQLTSEVLRQQRASDEERRKQNMRSSASQLVRQKQQLDFCYQFFKHDWPAALLLASNPTSVLGGRIYVNDTVQSIKEIFANPHRGDCASFMTRWHDKPLPWWNIRTSTDMRKAFDIKANLSIPNDPWLTLDDTQPCNVDDWQYILQFLQSLTSDLQDKIQVVFANISMG